MVTLALVYCLVANPYLCRTLRVERRGGLERCLIAAPTETVIDGLTYSFTGVRCDDGRTFIGWR